METHSSFSRHRNDNEQDNTNVKMEIESQSSEDQQPIASQIKAPKTAMFESTKTMEDTFDDSPPYDDEDDDTIYDNDGDGDDDDGDDNTDGDGDDSLDVSLNASTSSFGDHQQSHLETHRTSSNTPSSFTATPEENIQKSLMNMAANSFTPSKSSTRSPDRFQIELSNLPTALNQRVCLSKKILFQTFLFSKRAFDPFLETLFNSIDSDQILVVLPW